MPIDGAAGTTELSALPESTTGATGGWRTTRIHTRLPSRPPNPIATAPVGVATRLVGVVRYASVGGTSSRHPWSAREKPRAGDGIASAGRRKRRHLARRRRHLSRRRRPDTGTRGPVAVGRGTCRRQSRTGSGRGRHTRGKRRQLSRRRRHLSRRRRQLSRRRRQLSRRSRHVTGQRRPGAGIVTL
jgi:hypothetical protein